MGKVKFRTGVVRLEFQNTGSLTRLRLGFFREIENHPEKRAQTMILGGPKAHFQLTSPIALLWSHFVSKTHPHRASRNISVYILLSEMNRVPCSSVVVDSDNSSLPGPRFDSWLGN